MQDLNQPDCRHLISSSILGYDKDTLSLNVKRHFYIPLRRDRFIELLEKAAIPPTFVDTHADNNGAYTAYPITPVASRHPENFRTA